jgi:hypothetical protein
MLAAVLLAGACVAQADNYSGKLGLVEVKADGTRFLAQHEQLNLYASGAYKDALLAGYFRKAAFSIGYTPFPCGGGIRGKCGTVFSVAVEQAGFQ